MMSSERLASAILRTQVGRTRSSASQMRIRSPSAARAPQLRAWLTPRREDGVDDAQVREPVGVGLGHLDGAVGRAVVDDEDLPVALVVLLGEGVELGLDQRLAVEDRDHDAQHLGQVAVACDSFIVSTCS